MEITVPTELLSQVIAINAKAIKNTTNIPILRNILLNFQTKNLEILTTDLEIQIKTTLTIKSEQKLKTSIHAGTFSQYLNTLDKDNPTKLSIQKNQILVQNNHTRANFTLKSAEDFPTIDTKNVEAFFEISQKDLSNVIDKTVFAVAKDDLRPILTGILFKTEEKNLECVSLDTYRLSFIKVNKNIKINKQASVVIPAEALNTLNKILKDPFLQAYNDNDRVEVYIGKSNEDSAAVIIFKYGITEITIRILEGEYPNYKDIININSEAKVSVSHTELVTALKRVGIFAQNSISQKVLISFNKSNIKLKSDAQEMGETEEVIQTKDSSIKNNITIAFQLRFLNDIMNIINSEIVEINLTNEVSPVVIRDLENKNFLHLIMPLKQ